MIVLKEWLKSLVAVLLMTTFFYLLLTRPAFGMDKEYERAIKTAAKAWYVGSPVKDTIKKWEKRYVPEEIKPYGSVVGHAVKILVERKIVITFEFDL